VREPQSAYLVVTLLHRRARERAAFAGNAQRLPAELATIRCCRLARFSHQPFLTSSKSEKAKVWRNCPEFEKRKK
jgi:hypothetical protein